MDLMKETVEKVRPLERELDKLERKADHPKKEYREGHSKRHPRGEDEDRRHRGARPNPPPLS